MQKAHADDGFGHDLVSTQERVREEKRLFVPADDACLHFEALEQAKRAAIANRLCLDDGKDVSFAQEPKRARAKHHVDASHVEHRQVNAVVDVEQDVDVARPDAKARATGAKRAARLAKSDGEKSVEEPEKQFHDGVSTASLSVEREHERNRPQTGTRAAKEGYHPNVTARVLHPLVCTKCGASLPAAEGQQILVCPFCGQSHAFLPPPPAPAPGPLPWPRSSALALKIAVVGFGVLLLGGMAFSALFAARPATAPALTSPPAATPTALGPGDPKAIYKKGQEVDIHWGSSWWAGSVVDVNGATYRAHYEGYGSGSDEWVTADRLRTRVAEDAAAQIVDAAPEADAGDPNATYAVGDAVDIRWGSAWWKGRVKQQDGKRYFVGYDGYHSGWDEWVTAVRLRPRSAR